MTITTKYFAGQGKVYIASRTSEGLTSGFTWVGDADSLAINTSQDFLDVMESYTGNRTNVVHVPLTTDVSIELAVLNFDAANFARAFYGESATVAGASVTNEAHTAYNDQAIFLQKPKGISAVTITKGASTLVLDTDYSLDVNTGRVDFLPGSTIITAGAGHAVEVDYTHTGFDKMKALTQSIKEYSLIFEGKNLAENSKLVQVRLHRVQMNLSTTFSLIGTEANRLTLQGKLILDQAQGSGESKYFTYYDI